MKAEPIILTDEWFAQKARKYCDAGKLGRQNIRRAMFKQMRAHGLSDVQIELETERFWNAVDRTTEK